MDRRDLEFYDRLQQGDGRLQPLRCRRDQRVEDLATSTRFRLGMLQRRELNHTRSVSVPQRVEQPSIGENHGACL